MLQTTSTTQTSFHINGFWFHVNWNSKGTVGIDQHGDTWLNKANPRSEAGGLQVAAQTPKKAYVSSKELFMETRELQHTLYMNRMVKQAM